MVIVRLESGRVEGKFATEKVDPGLIPGWVKSKTTKIDIFSFPARPSAIKRDSEISERGRQVSA